MVVLSMVTSKTAGAARSEARARQPPVKGYALIHLAAQVVWRPVAATAWRLSRPPATRFMHLVGADTRSRTVSFRLAVLSDLHIDRRADADSWELAKAAFEAALAEGVDHLLVAGDFSIPHRRCTATATGPKRRYCAWAGELVPAKDRHWSNALFPYRRRLDEVTVVAADSTPDTTLEAAEGRWPKDEDRAVRALLYGIKGVRAWAARITAASQRRRQSDASPALYPWA